MTWQKLQKAIILLRLHTDNPAKAEALITWAYTHRHTVRTIPSFAYSQSCLLSSTLLDCNLFHLSSHSVPLSNCQAVIEP
jgi:hypothetical protein